MVSGKQKPDFHQKSDSYLYLYLYLYLKSLSLHN